MAIRSTSGGWGSVARALHWLSAVLILFGLTHGYWMANILQPRQIRLPQYAWHSTIFLYFGLLLLLRIVWRLQDRGPDDPAGSATWEKAAAHAGHLLLYGLMIWLLITGYMNWSAFPARFDPQRAADVKLFVFGVEVPALHTTRDLDTFGFWEHSHMYASWAMAALVMVHVAAALRHHFVKGNNVMRRMWSGGTT